MQTQWTYSFGSLPRRNAPLLEFDPLRWPDCGELMLEQYPQKPVQVSGRLGAWGAALHKLPRVVTAVNRRFSWALHEFPLRVTALRGESRRRSDEEAEGSYCE